MMNAIETSTSDRPSLSVVLPAYNETHRLPETLKELKHYLDSTFVRHEVVVVDDGSSDGTSELIREWQRHWPSLKLLVQPRNLGKGAAVKRGMLEASCDLIMFTDADLATPIHELELMLPYFSTGVDKAVVGVRTYQRDESKWRRILGLSLQIIAHLIVFDNAVVDSQCGFKLFGRRFAHELFQLVRISGGMFDVEIFCIMHKRNMEVVYQPVHWTNKAGSRINILRCMVFDIVDMVRIRANAMLGRYERSPEHTLQEEAVRVSELP
jgi:dolichyl-phosphate beta-glucosyltransferase